MTSMEVSVRVCFVAIGGLLSHTSRAVGSLRTHAHTHTYTHMHTHTHAHTHAHSTRTRTHLAPLVRKSSQTS